MNKILRTVSAFLLALSLTAIPVTAQPDHNGGRQSHFSSSQSNRGGGHNARPSGGNNGGQSRPGNPGNSSRPGGNGTGHRPGGNTGNNSGRPGGNHNNNNNNNNGHRPGGNPGNNHRPDNGHRPGGQPGNNHRPHRPTPPPPRPPRPHRPPVYFGSGHHTHHVPFFGNYHRPLPPPAWHPAVYGPSFGTILGIALGTTVDMTLRTLLNQGYNVTSYGNNVVYLTNVPQMNYYWPDAALYYNNGALCGSSFTYPSTYYDMSRYNALYNTFCGQYGVPVRSVNQGGIISSTWFGDGNRYVTLEFNSNYGDYYTTLSFGL